MPLSAEKEAEMKQEHFDKYEELSQRIGIGQIRHLILLMAVNTGQGPVPLANKIKASTDPYLNDVCPLTLWDRMAGAIGPNRPSAPDWPKLSFGPPWLPVVASGLSLAERVCVLKHVARHHLEEEVSPG